MYSYDYQYPLAREKPWLLKVCSSFLGRSLKFLKDFCTETNMHGFNHIAAERRHWAERLLWLCVMGVAIWGAVDLSMGQLQRYNENPTVVTLEKDFRSWRFNLPAVTACFSNRVDPAKLARTIEKHFNITPSDAKYEYYARFIDTVANSDLFHLEKFQEFSVDVQLNVDMFQLAVDVAYQIGTDNNLKTMTSEVSSIGWITVMTEAGVCYVTNSVASYDVALPKFNPNVTKMFPLTCTYSRNCYIKIDILSPFVFYKHSPYDVPDVSQNSQRIVLTEHHTVELNVMETRCGKGVKEIPSKRRGCLYTDEPRDRGRQVYSTNTCRLRCRSTLAKQMCGCVPFYYFYERGPQCNASGMSCLAGLSHRLTNNGGAKCPCPPQCVDSVYREITAGVQILGREPFSSTGSLKLVVQPPRTRYTREIVFHFQDLVVSFAGAAGLFLGASFISFVEILYFILERIFKQALRDKNSGTTKVNNAVMSYEMARIQQYTEILKTINSET